MLLYTFRNWNSLWIRTRSFSLGIGLRATELWRWKWKITFVSKIAFRFIQFWGILKVLYFFFHGTVWITILRLPQWEIISLLYKSCNSRRYWFSVIYISGLTNSFSNFPLVRESWNYWNQSTFNSCSSKIDFYYFCFSTFLISHLLNGQSLSFPTKVGCFYSYVWSTNGFTIILPISRFGLTFLRFYLTVRFLFWNEYCVQIYRRAFIIEIEY